MRVSDITDILGPVDETLIAEIGRTGATPEELAEAWAWICADEALVNQGRKFPTGRVAELVTLLETSDVEPDGR